MLARTDSGAWSREIRWKPQYGNHELVTYCHNRHPQYSVDYSLTETTAAIPPASANHHRNTNPNPLRQARHPRERSELT